jgi:hypothetical protein
VSRLRLCRHAGTLAIGVPLLLLLATPATAQARRAQPKPTRFTISFTGGAQAAPNDVSDHLTLPKNVETETIDVMYPMKPQVLVDIAAGVRVWKNLGLGVAVSRATGDGTADVTASVPHPFFFNQPRTVTGTENGIVHAETGAHLQLQYLVPASGHLRFVLAAGPSWATIEHEIVTNLTVVESYPYDAATFGGAVTKLSNASAVGFNASIDVTWTFAHNAGLGGLIRYTRADVDLDAGNGRSLAMKAGGIQGGIGIRLAF